jgi:hypothetical protein
MQVTTMFFGEVLAFVVYFILLKKNPEYYARRKKEAEAKGKQI